MPTPLDFLIAYCVLIYVSIMGVVLLVVGVLAGVGEIQCWLERRRYQLARK